ncbi:MAG: PH domain-containing protein [Acholeplasmataceae bacterium]|jgi:membrane protein YdbS with pleckstrin-like domain|nr:PH domain-containing protein [Acholeplasmataceae bacterium]
MKELFEPILTEGEEVVKTIKPNKTKTYFEALLMGIPFGLVLFIFGGVFGGMLNLDHGFPFNFSIAIIVFVVVLVSVIAGVTANYKNLVYVYTNKRLLIRKGIIGIDYKALDIAMIGAVEIDVSVVDKMVGKNTGSITFGSMANPIGTGKEGRNVFSFANVENPYELYKEIKNHIDEIKKLAAKEN